MLDSEDILAKVASHIHKNRIQVPYSTFACNTSFLSIKGVQALFREIKAPISTIQVTQVFDYLAQGEGGKKVHVGVLTQKLQTDCLIGEDSELERLESDSEEKKK